MRWAVEECQEEGAAKPILFVIAYRADRDTGECWAGQRRIAKEAGVTRTHVQRVMAKLVRDGILKVVEEGSGTTPRIVRIAPAWVEGEVTASGMVEGQVTASDIVEGQAGLAGEVIHNPSRQWPPHVAASNLADRLAATFGGL
jgi:DNA-binding transcriptional regulator LsrR (DeoR family)